ncbi:MAG: hypothetical protein JNL67_17550 [Planctomycetaceae bacterium]|nr:hypothetical protein [Planctomycetaceae bacterium]
MLYCSIRILPGLSVSFATFLLVLGVATIGQRNDCLAQQPSTRTTATTTANPLDVAQLLKKVQQNVDLRGSGGEPGSAYHALHIVYYRLQPGSSHEFVFQRDEAWLPVILKSIGYRSNIDQAPGDIPYEFFPYDVAWLLGEFCQGDSLETIREVAEAEDQHPLARLACYVALVRKQYSFDVEKFAEFVRTEEDRERRIIGILMLRWYGGDKKDLLLNLMSDDDVEVATAAACALTDLKPTAAITKYSELLQVRQFESLVLILRQLSEYPQQSARDLLERLLREALDGSRHAVHLGRIVDACADGWGIEQRRYRTSDMDSDKLQGQRVLELVEQLKVRQSENRRKIDAQLANCRTQLEVAEKIEAIRRDEYKRVLLLQSDLLVDATVGERAKILLDASSDEVADLRQQLLEVESLAKDFDQQRPRFD